MIAQLEGKIARVDIRFAVLSVGGVGYKILMPQSDLARLIPGSGAVFHVHTNVREGAIELFGFIDLEALNCFESLITISGLGPRTGLSVLSHMPASQVFNVINQGDHKSLTKIPGIGAKTAQRIVLELKDKIGTGSVMGMRSVVIQDAIEELRSALQNLGYKDKHIEKAVKEVKPLHDKGEPLEVLLKEALRIN